MSYNMKKSNLYGDSFMVKAKYQRIVDKITKDIKEGKLAITTPIAQGLLNKKVGDEVEIKIPNGTIKLRIDAISIA